MTQIKNPENGNQKGTVTIVGYSERFFMNAAPPVHIMKDLLEIGKVEKNGKIELDIDKESRIVFKCNQCSCRFSPIVVKPGDWVVLIYDQAMDCIVPVVTDSEHYGQAKMIYRETQKQKMIREVQRPAEIRALKRAGIYSLVVIALGIVAAIGVDIYNVIEQNKRSRSTDFSYVGNNTSVEGQSANYEAPKTIEDYDDILRQIEVCENARQNFLYEVDNVFVKANSPEYQGIMAQKIFWDANKALDKFNDEGEKLERLLRKHGFSDKASKHKEDREYMNRVYREEKRRAQGYR